MTLELYFSSLYYYMIAPAIYLLFWLLFTLIKPLGLCRWFLRTATARSKQDVKGVTKQQLRPLYRFCSLFLFIAFLLSLGFGLIFASSGPPKDTKEFLSSIIYLLTFGYACLLSIWSKAAQLGQSVLPDAKEKNGSNYLLEYTVVGFTFGIVFGQVVVGDIALGFCIGLFLGSLIGISIPKPAKGSKAS